MLALETNEGVYLYTADNDRAYRKVPLAFLFEEGTPETISPVASPHALSVGKTNSMHGFGKSRVRPSSKEIANSQLTKKASSPHDFREI